MALLAGLFRMAVLLLAGFVLSGCFPAASRDEEKEPHFLTGRSRVNAMDFKGAIESFEKALEVNPRSAPAHFELGWLFDQKEPDPAAAIYHYERYLRLSPNSGREETVKTRILACKQVLVQSVSLVPGMEKQQHDLEQLVEENKRLRADIEKWRVYTLRPQSLTNQPGQAFSGARAAQTSGSGQLAAGGSKPSDSTGATGATAIVAAAPRTHTVKAGETPDAIARRYGVKLAALMAANPRLDARRMRVGQTLNIPPP